MSKPTIITNPPKQGTPTGCVGCGKNLTPKETYGDLCSPLCWDCHSSLFDKAQDNHEEEHRRWILRNEGE